MAIQFLVSTFLGGIKCDQLAQRRGALTMFLIAAGTLGAMTFSAESDAQAGVKAANPVQIQLQRKKVSVVEGKEAFVAAETAKPGDIVEETATYANISEKTFRVDATLPVPLFTEFVASTARPASMRASVDGKVFSELPLKRQTKQANGVTVEQLVPLSDYKFLRWSAVELGPEKSFTVTARFRIKDGAPVTPAATTPTAVIAK